MATRKLEKVYFIDQNEKASKNFTVKELACNDGSINLKIIDKCREKLQHLRSESGCVFILNSAYRSLEYNRSIGSSDKSQHVVGTAFDIRWTDTLKRKFRNMDNFKDWLVENGVKGIGLYDTFVHVDWRENPNPRGYSFWDSRG